MKIKVRNASCQCPQCGHQWGRQPSLIERIFGSAASGMIDTRLLLYLWSPRCAICGKKFKSIDQVLDSVTVDHIVPKSAGGPNHITNYQLAHSSCNLQKGGHHSTSPKKVTVSKLPLSHRLPDDIVRKLQLAVNVLEAQE